MDFVNWMIFHDVFFIHTYFKYIHNHSNQVRRCELSHVRIDTVYHCLPLLRLATCQLRNQLLNPLVHFKAWPPAYKLYMHKIALPRIDKNTDVHSVHYFPF